MRPLTELIRAVSEPLQYPPETMSLVITGITADSRKVAKDNLFVAVAGVKSDGATFIAQAKQHGAQVVLCDDKASIPDASGLTVIRTKNTRRALAQMASAFYRLQPAHIVAITGTDGKTSTADFFRQLWHHMGASSASIGTLGSLGGDGRTLSPGSHTTPDPMELHRLLAQMEGQRITHVAMEASSHGLHQHRLDGVRLQAGAFTNIARDHLDYHKDEDDYFTAKSRLFSELLPKGAVAVLNRGDARFAALEKICKTRGLHVVEFGREAADLRIDRLTPHARGQKAELTIDGKAHSIEIPLVGAFQVMNILAALGLARAVGGDIHRMLSVLPKLAGVPGRLEHVVSLVGGASVYVDYAHTPMALANILQTLRPHTKGKLHVVFGCGGDRDPGKRPEMGKAAATLADSVIVTDDNPRSEVPAAIRAAILAAAPGAKEVADRKEAIYLALQSLGPSDILVIAGKGHEKTQTVGDKVFPFDDVEVARQGAKELKLAA